MKRGRLTPVVTMTGTDTTRRDTTLPLFLSTRRRDTKKWETDGLTSPGVLGSLRPSMFLPPRTQGLSGVPPLVGPPVLVDRT